MRCESQSTIYVRLWFAQKLAKFTSDLFLSIQFLTFAISLFIIHGFFNLKETLVLPLIAGCPGVSRFFCEKA